MAPRRFSDAEELVIRDQYEAGETSPQVAARWGTTHHTVIEAVRRTGGVVRPSSRKRRVGSKRREKEGVMLIIAPDDPFACMAYGRLRVLEHRYVMAQALGRPLRRDEQVHHVNGDHFDNRIENLELRQGAHGSGIRIVCLNCGSHNVAPIPLGGQEEGYGDG